MSNIVGLESIPQVGMDGLLWGKVVKDVQRRGNSSDGESKSDGNNGRLSDIYIYAFRRTGLRDIMISSNGRTSVSEDIPLGHPGSW